MMGQSVAIFGTSSGVGKTTVTAAMCRYFSLHGLKVFPFKAFNLSSISFERDGLTAGWAQYIQALACGRRYEPSMNPVFCLYENGRKRFIINGEEMDLSGIDDLSFMRERASEAYERALSENDLVIVEGSGSCCELNLANSDVANMYFAKRHDIPVIITGSIADGGVFASLYGTVALMDECGRRLIKGLIVNRFMGNMDSFREGRDILERVCGVPVVAVMPNVGINMPQEDRGARIKPEDVDEDVIINDLDELAEVFRTHVDTVLLGDIIGLRNGGASK